MLGLFFIFRYFAYFILMFNLVSKKKKKNRRAEQCWEGLPAGGNARCSSVQPASLQPPVSSRTRAHVYQPSAVSQDLFNGKPSALSVAACLQGSEGGREERDSEC